jgi:lysophospholipase L1-like esterase
MTGRIRHNLQSRFGDGGVGFVLPTKPLRWYGHADVEIGRGAGWDVLGVRKAHDLDRRVGPSGFALRAHNTASASIRLRTSDMGIKRRARLQVYYLQQPAGGHVRIVLDGGEAKTWSTASEGMVELGGYYESTLRRMPEHLEVDALGDGPVTLYGLALERSGAGVVLDTLGIPGARAKDQLLTDDDMYREHLIKREPNLVVLAYGTNEGTDTGESLELFEQHLRHVVVRLKDAVPGASCLIVGPTDHPLRVGKLYRARKRTTQIIDSERRIAGENRCGFIDLVSVTGGPMSMMRMVADHFAGPDHTHFTRRGYEALADAISGAMVNGWNNWQKTSCE